MKSFRAFIAVDIPDEIKYRIYPLSKKLNEIKGIKAVEPRNLHITLKFLGDITFEQAGKIEGILSKLEERPFRVELENVSVFPDERYIRVVWIGCKSKRLIELGNRINVALSGMFKEEAFTPHLTIARVKRRVDLKEFLKENKNKKFGSFIVRDFKLKKSTLTRNGPIYEDISLFQLNEEEG